MSNFEATPSQKSAISTRGSAVIVSAGAGSGKTRVLTERLMSYICDGDSPADLDSFLIITFTRAAAGELRGRISEELARRLAADPGNKRLRRQNALCQRAQIGTIHSFCASILREYSHVFGISPDFRIADEERSNAMKLTALERTLDERYENPEKYPDFISLADTVGAGRDDRRLSELVLSLNERMQSHARPELWAQQQAELMRGEYTDAAQTPWGAEIMEWARDITAYWVDETDRLLSLMSPHEKICKAYGNAFEGMGESLRELLRRLNTGWDKAREMGEINFPGLGRLVNSPDPALSEMLKSRRDACKDDMKRVFRKLSATSAELLSQQSSTAPAMAALLQLTLDFDRAFSADKRSRSMLDYNDLEHYAARLLTDENGEPTAIARDISHRFTEIMVDEYQDVSRVQDSIFRAVSKDGRNLFMVGDVKQSIYRFRLAEPEIFNEKYLTYADHRDAAPGEPRRILLRENFRSRREVLDGANSVFKLCMSRALGDMDYDNAAALRAGASYEGTVPVPEVILVDPSPDSDDEEAPGKTECEAGYVARQIKRLVESGTTVSDHGNLRPMEYGDIAILLRSANKTGGIFRQALLESGVPAGSGQGGGFFSSVEVSTVISMLALMDNPHQDIPLIAVLRSPVFGFSADELTRIRATDRKKDLYSAMVIRAETDPKCAGFLTHLRELRDDAPDLCASDLVWEILDRFNMLSLCSAMDDGELRRARLLELVGMGEKFEATGYRGVHRFVLWLRKLSEKGQEPSLGASAASAVQIMSIHKSKGLEFPVVFLCNTDRQFSRNDLMGPVLVHPELGLGPKLTDTVRRVEYPTLARAAIAQRMENEMKSEEMRLLYVALTRAKERLFVTAGVTNTDKKLEKLSSALTVPMPPELLRRCGNMADWMIYSCLADPEHLRMTVVKGKETGEETKEQLRDETAPSPEDMATLRRNLSFRYGSPAAVTMPSKITATELKGRFEEDPDSVNTAPKKEFTFALPRISRTERPLTAAEKGVATHLTMQYIDFSKTDSRESIALEVERLCRQGYLSEKEAECVDVNAILKLFRSPLGERMCRAEKLVREFRFSLLWDGAEIDSDAAGEELLMQGVVDCCIFEGDSITVIDYKTDRVKTRSELEGRAELYRGQISAYAKAMERIFGIPVREGVLYFLASGKAVKIYEKP